MKVTILALCVLPVTVSALCPSRREFFQVSASAAAVAVSGPAFATYTGKPTEAAPKTEAKEKWNTLYPEKKLNLEKKSPVDRLDLAPPTYQTYKKTYPGLTEALGN